MWAVSLQVYKYLCTFPGGRLTQFSSIRRCTQAFYHCMYNTWYRTVHVMYHYSQELIDWSKPLLSQITQLGEVYDDWVHTPVNHSLRLFQSDLLESCTKCPWWLVPLCWIPYSFYMMWLATTHIPCTLSWIEAPVPLDWMNVVALLPMGILIWTLIEYCLHRFIFHMNPPQSGLWLQFHFAIHGQHHKVHTVYANLNSHPHSRVYATQVPFDNMRLVFPPLPAGIIMLILYVALLHVLPLAALRAMFAGGILGYISYDMLHYFFHHGSPQPGSYLANLKSYHIAHHYINPNLGNILWNPFYWDPLDASINSTHLAVPNTLCNITTP